MTKHRTLNQQKVLALAWEMGRTDGIAQLNFQTLAKRLDIRSQSLYNYYPNIDALVEAMGTQLMSTMYEKLVIALTGISGREALAKFAETAHNYLDSSGNLVQLIYYVHHYADDSPFVLALARVVKLLKQLVATVELKTMHREAFVQGLIASMMGYTVLEVMNFLPNADRASNYHEMLALYLDNVKG